MNLITALLGICLATRVFSLNIRKDKDSRNCRRFLNTKIAFVCSHKTDPEEDPPAEPLQCGNNNIKELVAVYIGLKHTYTTTCRDKEEQASKFVPKCCTLEQNDTLINIKDLKGVQDKIYNKQLEYFESNCKNKHSCSLQSVVVRVSNVLSWRNYSNFIVWEYRCSNDTKIGESIHDTSPERKTALTCSYKTTLRKNATVEELQCPDGRLINVTNVYFGLKHGTNCPDGDHHSTGHDEDCCRYEDQDYIFDAFCVRDKQISNSTSYDDVITDVNACNSKTQCSVPSRILQSTQNISTRTHFSYIIVEYKCTDSPTSKEISQATLRQGESSTIPDLDENDSFPGVQVTTIVSVVGGVLLAAALVTGIICHRKRKKRRTSNDHVNSLPGTRYEDMPLADQGLRDQTVSAGATGHNDDDTYDHALLGNGRAAMKGKTQDPDDTYDHASGSDAKRLASMRGNASEVDDTYDHAGRGTGSASMKGKASDTDDTYNHAMINSGTASMKGKTSDVDDVYDHALIESMKDETKEFDDTYDHAQVENGQASLKGKTEDIDDTYNQAM